MGQTGQAEAGRSDGERLGTLAEKLGQQDMGEKWVAGAEERDRTPHWQHEGRVLVEVR